VFGLDQRTGITTGGQRCNQKQREFLVYPHTSYLILATPRSGSYLYCESLINTHLAGYPIEYFGPLQLRAVLRYLDTSNHAEWLAWILKRGTTPNGVFGGKIIWQFHEDLIDWLQEIDGYEKLSTSEVLSTAFPNLRYLWATRRDKVRQAISYWKALQTRAWKDMNNKDWQANLLPKADNENQVVSNLRVAYRNELPPLMQDPVFDYHTIERLRRGLEEDDVEIEQYCTSLGIEPFKVVYEDFVNAYEETALQILEYLQIPFPKDLVFGERQLQKQANAQSEEWLQLYYEQHARGE
jgi:LPS sulfotransferase NodH